MGLPLRYVDSSRHAGDGCILARFDLEDAAVGKGDSGMAIIGRRARGSPDDVVTSHRSWWG